MQIAKIDPMIGTMLTVAINEPLKEMVMDVMVSWVVPIKTRAQIPVERTDVFHFCINPYSHGKSTP